MSTTAQTTKTNKPKKPKAPADHKPKGEKPKVVRTAEGAQVTLRGITVTILNEAFDDWELLEALGELDKDKPASVAVLPGLLKRALAPGDNARVLDLLRDKTTGRVPLVAGVEFVLELFRAVNPNA